MKKKSAYGSKVSNQITSQAVESFNSFKSHYAQKSLKLATSTKIRYLIATLSWNDRMWAFDFTISPSYISLSFISLNVPDDVTYNESLISEHV